MSTIRVKTTVLSGPFLRFTQVVTELKTAGTTIYSRVLLTLETEFTRLIPRLRMVLRVLAPFLLLTVRLVFSRKLVMGGAVPKHPLVPVRDPWQVLLLLLQTPPRVLVLVKMMDGVSRALQPKLPMDTY